MKLQLGNPVVKKVLGISMAVFSGIVTVAGALADQKREQEFEALKKTVSELANK